MLRDEPLSARTTRARPSARPGPSKRFFGVEAPGVRISSSGFRDELCGWRLGGVLQAHLVFDKYVPKTQGTLSSVYEN